MTPNQKEMSLERERGKYDALKETPAEEFEKYSQRIDEILRDIDERPGLTRFDRIALAKRVWQSLIDKYATIKESAKAEYESRSNIYRELDAEFAQKDIMTAVEFVKQNSEASTRLVQKIKDYIEQQENDAEATKEAIVASRELAESFSSFLRVVFDREGRQLPHLLDDPGVLHGQLRKIADLVGSGDTESAKHVILGVVEQISNSSMYRFSGKEDLESLMVAARTLKRPLDAVDNLEHIAQKSLGTTLLPLKEAISGKIIMIRKKADAFEIFSRTHRYI